jgi:hypothetical protein
MYLCTYVLLYLCTYVLLCLCTYVLMYFCTHVLMYSCTYVLMYSCTYVLMYFCTHVLMYLCTHVLMYSCTFVLMYLCNMYFASPLASTKLIVSNEIYYLYDSSLISRKAITCVTSQLSRFLTQFVLTVLLDCCMQLAVTCKYTKSCACALFIALCTEPV